MKVLVVGNLANCRFCSFVLHAVPCTNWASNVLHEVDVNTAYKNFSFFAATKLIIHVLYPTDVRGQFQKHRHDFHTQHWVSPVTSHSFSAHSLASFMTTMGSPAKLQHVPVATAETSYQTAQPSKKSLVERSGTVQFWNEDLEPADRCWVNEHEDDLFESHIKNHYVPHLEPSDVQTGEYMTHS